MSTLKVVFAGAGFALAGCLLFPCSAAADVGACGLENGMWATPKEACQYAGRPDEAAKRFGEDALLEWRLGYYLFEGANCSVFSSKLVEKQCTLRVECSYQGLRTVAEWGIEVQTSQQFRFGTRPNSPIYYYCASDVMPR